MTSQAISRLYAATCHASPGLSFPLVWAPLRILTLLSSMTSSRPFWFGGVGWGGVRWGGLCGLFIMAQLPAPTCHLNLQRQVNRSKGTKELSPLPPQNAGKDSWAACLWPVWDTLKMIHPASYSSIDLSLLENLTYF